MLNPVKAPCSDSVDLIGRLRFGRFGWFSLVLFGLAAVASALPQVGVTFMQLAANYLSQAQAGR